MICDTVSVEARSVAEWKKVLEVPKPLATSILLNYFDVVLTVRLSIILAINQLNAQNLLL